MIQFYTKEFFEELGRRLNADAEWAKAMAGRDVRIVCSAPDKKRAFLISIAGGKVATSEASSTTPTDFRFEGRYATWVQLCKGEVEFLKLIQTGKIRMVGSMPEVMGMMGPLNHIVLMARSFPKEF